MKLLPSCLALLAAALSPALAQLTQGERDRALSELHASRKQFLDAIEGLSDAQWNFKPDANTWSVAECAEHITLSEDLLYGLIARKIAGSPAQPEKKAEVKDKDGIVLAGVVDRSRKFKAPESLAPTHQWPTRQALIDRFKPSRDRTLEYVRTTQDDLRSHFADHPVFKTLDGYQWILLLAGHTERHTAQIDEVKANPNFPKP